MTHLNQVRVLLGGTKCLTERPCKVHHPQTVLKPSEYSAQTKQIHIFKYTNLKYKHKYTKVTRLQFKS